MRLCIILLFFPLIGFCQLTLNRPSSPTQLVRTALISEGSNIVISNVKFTGNPGSVARFYNESNRALLQKGIVLTTGYIPDIKGPNNSPNTGGPMLKPGDRDLSRIARSPTLDAVVLEFDFNTPYDSIAFEYFFGSEEYPEYVNQGLNDVFAFLLKKVDGGTYKNLAQLPDGKGPISVDNVNAYKNKEYFITNPPFNGREVLDWEQDKDLGEISLTYQFDGLTKVLVACSKIEPNQTYHLKIAIADAGDELYDSGVFLKAGSFKPYSSVESIKAKTEELKLFSGFNKSDLVTDSLGNYHLTTHLKFSTDESIILNESFEVLKQVLSVLYTKLTWKIVVNGHTDSDGEDTYNLKLSQERAAAVASYLMQNNIETNRVAFFGFGDTEPMVENSTNQNKALNRRVEFVFVR